MSAAAPQKAELLEFLAPLLERVAQLNPAERDDDASQADLVAQLATDFPEDGPLLAELGERLITGVKEGWLCDRGEPNARFCRVGKPGEATHDLSIDVVNLTGPAVAHTHPKGEVTIGYTLEGDPTFDGFPPGWVFMGPGSHHVPTVEGGRMVLIYFLPDGAVEWG